ncbi:MAG: hypothetical protein ACRDLO_07620 [Solirubrobacterales bacterium]
MFNALRTHLTYANAASSLALFLVLGGAGAYALDGLNTVFSDDIVDGQVKSADVGKGEVKLADVGAGAVDSSKIADGQVKTADVADGSLTGGDVRNDTLTGNDVAGLTGNDLAPNSIPTGRITDGSLTGADVANNSLKGADIDESTLDVGDAARAYAWVDPDTCTGTPVSCTPFQSKGISSVTRDSTGVYCVTAPGIDASVTPAAVTVDFFSTAGPAGHASAMTSEGSECGASGEGFRVFTQRHPQVTVDKGGGTNNTIVAGSAVQAGDVGFTIVIP